MHCRPVSAFHPRPDPSKTRGPGVWRGREVSKSLPQFLNLSDTSWKIVMHRSSSLWARLLKKGFQSLFCLKVSLSGDELVPLTLQHGGREQEKSPRVKTQYPCKQLEDERFHCSLSHYMKMARAWGDVCSQRESSTWNSSWRLNLPSFFWMLWAPYLTMSPSRNYLFFCLEAPWGKHSAKPDTVKNSSRLP